MQFNPEEHQHCRFNPLLGQWILVSPHRMKRPWSGQIETAEQEKTNSHITMNPLCPGATRPCGETNPNYTSTFVFKNDFPALLEDVPTPPSSDDHLFQVDAARGTCRVMCFHSSPDLTIPLMSVEEIVAIIDRWVIEMVELCEKYTWVQIFENKGAIMGCSNPHPHCQIWASSFLPNEPRIKDLHQKNYFEKYKRPLLMDYMDKELQKEERLVITNDHWIVVVPYWAVWPYETMILPRRHILRMFDMTDYEKTSLAATMKELTIRYDNLFKCSFPYSMGWHGAPGGNYMKEDTRHWTFHGCYFPPLLRSSTVKKFMVGYEMLAQSQRDLTPEQAAYQLRELPDKHYMLT